MDEGRRELMRADDKEGKDQKHNLHVLHYVMDVLE